MSNDTLTAALAKLAIETPHDAIAEPARLATRRLILDSLGCALAGWNAPGIQESISALRPWGGASDASVWFHNMALPTPNAAFINGAMLHALDYDDVHYRSVLHLMSSLLPAAVAIAELRNCSGKALVSACALGYEVAARIGIVAKALNMGYGYLPSSTVGIFGVTAACCRLLGLDAATTTDALGLAYAQSSGNRQALRDMTLTKRLQPALAARSALWAAQLAAAGISGPQHALEGEAGFFRVYAGGDPPAAADLAGLPDVWEIENVSIKAFPSCGANHRVTQAAIQLASEEDLQPQDIAEVHLHIGYKDVWFVGDPWRLNPQGNPQVDAQFNISYSAALALLRRKAGLQEYSVENVLNDREVDALAQKAQIHEIPNTRHLHTDQVEVTVRVVTSEGAELSRSAQALKGQPDNPFTFDELIDKYWECVHFAGIYSEDRAQSLLDAVTDLDKRADMRSFVGEHLAPAGEPAFQQVK